MISVRKLVGPLALGGLLLLAYLLVSRPGPESETEAAPQAGAQDGSGAGVTRAGSGAPGSAAGDADPQRAKGAEAAPGPTPVVEQVAVAADGFIELLVTAAGKPVPGAAVRLYLRGRTDPNTAQVEWRLAGAGITGEAGKVRLAARPGAYLASARARGFAPAQREVKRAQGEPVSRAALELAAGATLAGRTLSKGEAVPLAQVTLSPRTRPGSRVDVPAEERVLVTSDERGRFTAQGLAPGDWQVEARAPGFGKAEKSATVPRQGELLLELQQACFLEGRVVREGGAPVPGAEVTGLGGREPALAVASSSGTFSLEVEPGRWTLSARSGSEAGNAPQPLLALAGQTVRGVEIKLGKGSAIEGVVVTKGGAPIAGAHVDVSPNHLDGDLGRGVSGPDGRYAVEGLAPGSYDVVFSAEGFVTDDHKGISVLPGQRFTLKAELKGVGRVEGTVVDGNGNPVEGVRARAQRSADGTSEALTGADGRFLLGGLPPGRQPISVLRQGASLGVSQQVEVVEGQTAKADFTLGETGTVTGRINRKTALPDGLVVTAGRAQMAVPTGDFARGPVDSGGNYRFELPPGSYRIFLRLGDGMSFGGPQAPVVQVEAGKTAVQDLALPEEREDQTTVVIQVLETGGAPAPRALVQVHSGQTDLRFSMFLQADEQGRATLQRPLGDLPSTLEVRAQRGGRVGTAQATRDQQQINVTLQPGGRVEGHLAGAPAQGTFEVKVTADGDGSDVFSDGDSQTFSGERFVLDDVAAGQSRISVKTGDGRRGEAHASVQTGQTAQVEVALAPAARITGRVTDESGKPLADATVFADRAHLEHTGSDGRFTLEDLAPGEHSVTVYVSPTTTVKGQTVTLAEGQALDVGDLVASAVKAGPGEVGLYVRGDSGGVSVMMVIAGSPAEQAGVFVGDTLLDIDGKPVTGAADARMRLRGAPGSQVIVRTSRQGTTKVVTIVRAS